MGKQEDGDHDPREQVSEDDLQEAEISVEGQGRGADDGEGAGFRGYDGEADRPPRRGASSEEVVGEVFLSGAETGSEPRDGDQVPEDNRKIDVTHERGVGETPSSIPLICYDLSAGTRRVNPESNEV